MPLAITYSRASAGIDAPFVTVEAHISYGLPALNIVGLPETVVKESKDRVRSAILNSQFEFPIRRITVNLAPADIPKEGGRFDLPIALGILAASGQLVTDQLSQYEFAGELALSGELRAIRRAIPFALATKQSKRILILPEANAREAGLVADLCLYPAKHLLEVYAHLTGQKLLQQYIPQALSNTTTITHDLSEVRGQHHAKRALEIAAAGQHSLLFIGPPGIGKTMLSSCLSGILPPMTENEALELAAINSIAGHALNPQTWRVRPFRSPHHTASCNALVGGGNPPKPGEISLAHHGVLFLDELPEYKRQALEALREPMESGCITISRACHQVFFPAKFQLIAAMNPCPCGQHGNNEQNCRCTLEQIKRYQARISGPLLDRFDIQIAVPPLPKSLLTTCDLNEPTSMTVRNRVQAARAIQLHRGGKSNALLSNKEIHSFCQLGSEQQQFLDEAMTRLKISARAFNKILKVARTMADLEDTATINSQHIKEALSYRCLDKYNNIS
jgi:magnesium chelatase family protein